jgi:hypothetical protein
MRLATVANFCTNLYIYNIVTNTSETDLKVLFGKQEKN